MKELKIFAEHLASESGKIIREYFRSELSVEIKNDESPVTIADKKSEEIMRELIIKEFPAHGIVGEEFGEYNPGAEYKWIIDPIDGTKSFICGATTFGTLIALLKGNEPLLGVINQPVLNELMIGDNEVTTFNGKQVKVRQCSNLSSAVLLTTDLLNFEKYRNLKNFEELIRSTKLFRMWGDCYGYMLLAAGYADIMIDPIMNKWDLAALIPVVNGAGGKITDYYGYNPLLGDSTVATAGPIHDEVLKILNRS